MTQKLTINIWAEDEELKLSVNGDNPTVFKPPMHFLKEYLEKKELKKHYIIPFGEALYRSVFITDRRRELIKELFDKAEQEKLIIHIQSDIPDVHDIPWEIIKDPERNTPWALLGNVAFYRSTSQNFLLPKPISPPIRILIVLSLPVEVYKQAPIDPLKEIEIINQALDEWRDFVKVDTLVKASWNEIRKWLQKKNYHILHFTGHGGAGGILILEDETDYQKSKEIQPEQTKELFEKAGLRAVILNACNTATSTIFSPSSAMMIYEAGIPLVIANQAPVRDDEAIKMTKELYKAIFSNTQLSYMLNYSRLDLEEWWKPVLFLNPDLTKTKLFNLTQIPDIKPKNKLFRDLGTFGNARLYIYRYQPLRKITELFFNGEKIITLHGLGGVGKSFMADYIARFLKTRFDYVLAIDLKEDLEEKTFQEIKRFISDTLEDEEIISSKQAKELKKSGIRSFWTQLNKNLHNSPFLLILDNFEEVQDKHGKIKDRSIKEFLRAIKTGSWNGLCLITTRLIPYITDRVRLEPVVEMETYSRPEQILFFINLSDKYKDIVEKLSAKIDKIDKFLNWHPFAVELLLRNPDEDPLRITEYKEIKELMEFYSTYIEEYPKEFSLFFKLRYPFSRDLLKTLVNNPSFEELVLEKLRLAKKENETYSIYNILPLTIKDKIKNYELNKEVINSLLSFKSNNIPFDDMNIVELIPERGLKKEQKNLLAKKYNNLGIYYYRTGYLDKALKYHEKALDIRKAIYGEKHPDVATSYNNIALVYRAKGELNTALKYHKKALDIIKAIYGEKHPDVATSYNNIAGVYYDKGELNTALKYHEKALDIRKAIHGEKHPDVATSYNNIAVVYHDKGELNNALKYHEKALDIRKAIYGEKHPYVATSYNNIALVYHDKGELNNALKYHEKALDIRKAIYGEKHPYVATSYNNIAEVYHDKGELNNALKYHEKALDIRKAIYGEKHYYVLYTSLRIADICIRSGKKEKYKDALNIALNCLDILVAERHPHAIRYFLNFLTTWKKFKERFGECRSISERILSIRKNLALPPQLLSFL